MSISSGHRPDNALSQEARDGLLEILQSRFEKNIDRHQGLEWTEVEAQLGARPQKLRSLSGMERTGGEPDVIGRDEETGGYLFCDCSAESPVGRRSLCYDQAALEARKQHKPESSAVAVAAAMGIELLSETQYRALQAFGPFDKKTSSWLAMPPRRPQARRCPLRRPPLRSGFCLPQRRGFVLRGAGIPRVAEAIAPPLPGSTSSRQICRTPRGQKPSQDVPPYRRHGIVRGYGFQGSRYRHHPTR